MLCPFSRNHVSSDAQDEAHRIERLRLAADGMKVWKAPQEVLNARPRTQDHDGCRRISPCRGEKPHLPLHRRHRISSAFYRKDHCHPFHLPGRLLGPPGQSETGRKNSNASGETSPHQIIQHPLPENFQPCNKGKMTYQSCVRLREIHIRFYLESNT